MTARTCYMCGNKNGDVLERHHIVPRRFGGSDDDENLVDLCSNCHSAIEKLYNKRFYDALEVSTENSAENPEIGPCHRQGCTALGVKTIVEGVWGCETHKKCVASGCSKNATEIIRDCKGEIQGACTDHACCQCPGCGAVGDSVYTPKSRHYGVMCHTHAKMKGVAP